MTDQQPEALRLADRLDLYATGDDHQRDTEEAATELRRLHKEHLNALDELADLGKVLDRREARIEKLEQVLGMAVEALEEMSGGYCGNVIATARQALGGAA